MYVADTGNGRVQWFDASGAYLGSLKLAPGPLDVAVGPTGDVYALNHSAVTVIRDGAIAASWGANGTEPGQFTNPRGLAVAPNGDVFVVDAGADAIDQFTAEGDYLATVQQPAARRRRRGRLDEHTGPDPGCDPRRAALDLHGVDAPVAAAAQPDGARVAVAEREPDHQGAAPRPGTEVRLFLTDDCSGGAGVRGRCGRAREHGDRGSMGRPTRRARSAPWR